MVPHLLLGLCVLLTAALCANAFTLLGELNPAFDRAYAEMNGPHLCCLWNHETIPPDEVRDYMDGWRDRLTYQITERTKTIDYMENDGVRLSNGILLELPATLDRDMLSPAMPDGKRPEMPGQNEIWVTTKMAGILGLRPGGGLVLQLGGQPVRMKVARIVADPVFGGGGTNIYRMWCGPGQLSRLPLAGNNAASYLEIRFQEYSPEAERVFIRDAERQFHMPLGDAIYTYERIKGGYTGLYHMAGAVLSLVSAVLACTVIALTWFLVRSDMEEDVRTIGIYSALGMSGAQVTGVYLGRYGAVGLAGASVGSVLGGALSRGVIKKVLGDAGIYGVSKAGTGMGPLFAGILVAAAVAVSCACALLKVRRLNVSHAIRTGARREKEPNRKPSGAACYQGRASFARYYAVRGMRSRAPRYVYIAGLSLILGSLSILCLGCLHAAGNIDRDPEIWGFIKTDIYVTSLGGTPVSGIIGELEQDPRVLYTYGVNKVSSQYQTGSGEGWRTIPAEVYELPWKEQVKDRSLCGRRPVREGEVGVGLALARQYGLNIGQTVTLVVNGRKGQYEITGIFQTLSNYGNVVRMVTDNLDRFAGADGAYGDYMLVLAGGTDQWEYAQELAGRYGGAFSFIAAKSNGENIAGVLRPAVGAILTVLFAAAVLITVNLTFLLVRREQRQIGLLKAVGMTSGQIVKIYSWRNGLSALAGNSLSLALGIFALPELLAPWARTLGMPAFPFSAPLAGTAACFFLLPACMVLGTYTAARAIGRVTVRQLVSE